MTIELPDDLAIRAELAGLLEPRAVARVFEFALDSSSRSPMREHLDRVESDDEEPMSLDEIQAVVDEVRAERRARGASRD